MLLCVCTTRRGVILGTQAKLATISSGPAAPVSDGENLNNNDEGLSAPTSETGATESPKVQQALGKKTAARDGVSGIPQTTDVSKSIDAFCQAMQRYSVCVVFPLFCVRRAAVPVRLLQQYVLRQCIVGLPVEKLIHSDNVGASDVGH